MAPERAALAIARCALFASLLAAAFAAAGADLGKATVRSRIGQPLNAEIEVVSLKPGEDKKLGAALASRDAYRKAGVQFNPTLAGVRVVVARRNGRPVVRLSSAQSVNDTHVETLIRLRSNGQAVLRRYTIFLEPPGTRKPSVAQAVPLGAAALAAKPAAAPVPSQAPAAPALAAGAAAPGSRDELFGLPPRESAGAIAPASRDELFGLPPREGKAAAAETKGPQWRGFVQNTTAYDFRDEKHWSRAVVRTQLGTQGGSGNFKWKASARLDVDPVYFNSGYYPEPVRHDQRADFFLRETYVDTSLGGLQLRLGKQHIVWGEMVGLFFADVVSARDQRDFILPEFDIIRIPQWAARVEHFGANWHGEFIWLPYPETDNIGKPGAEFFPWRLPPPPGFDQQFNNDEKPVRNLRNSNWGLRLSTLRAGWDMSAFYYRSNDVNPTFYREIVPGPSAPTLLYTPRHDRIWQLGGTVAKDFGSVVGKAEAVYTGGRNYSVTRVTEPQGVVPQDTVLYALGLDFTLPREARLNLQYFDNVFLDHDPELLQDKHEGGVSMLLSGKFGSLSPELLIIQSVNRNDRLARWKLNWAVSSNWRLTGGVDVFHGPQVGFFGRFNDRDRVYAEARYDF